MFYLLFSKLLVSTITTALTWEEYVLKGTKLFFLSFMDPSHRKRAQGPANNDLNMIVFPISTSRLWFLLLFLDGSSREDRYIVKFKILSRWPLNAAISSEEF